MAAMPAMNSIYKNPNEPIESRVKDLLSRLTVKEKLGQMTQIERSVATPTAIRDLCIGSVLSGGGSKPFDKAKSADWADMVDGFQKAALESRLGIPIFYGSDAVHGNNNVYGATVFPHNVGLGATRDADLVRRIGVATALEVRASGVQYAFAPCVAVCRDPRWGRCYESYSEDPEIVRMMNSLVTGLQDGFCHPSHDQNLRHCIFIFQFCQLRRSPRFLGAVQMNNMQITSGNLKILKSQQRHLLLNQDECQLEHYDHRSLRVCEEVVKASSLQ